MFCRAELTDHRGRHQRGEESEYDQDHKQLYEREALLGWAGRSAQSWSHRIAHFFPNVGDLMTGPHVPGDGDAPPPTAGCVSALGVKEELGTAVPDDLCGDDNCWMFATTQSIPSDFRLLQ